jgi:tetratricopeptide (TPR) repeat protein
MNSCILLFYLSLSAAAAVAQPADALYADRTTLASARRAAEIWRAALVANPGDFDAAWKVSRADYWLGGHAPESERRGLFEQGVEAGQKAIALGPNKPHGHFWTAANMGALAESFGIRAGLKYRKPIKDALETVLRLDAAFLDGSADRALGRWYQQVPGLFGGSHTKAEAHLKASLTYKGDGTASYYFLAELYLDDGRKAEARRSLQQVIDAPLHPDWTPEDQEFKDKATRLLNSLRD